MVVTRDWPCYREQECGELMAALDMEQAAEFPGRYDERGPVWRDDDGNYQEPVPEYSTDIRDAWLLVEKLHADGWYIAAFDYPDALSVSVTCPHGPCRKHGGQRHSIRQWHGAEGVRGSTMPHAICLAALEALTPETHEDQAEQTER
jgi:Phage ABA sandwich domain